MFRPFSRKAAAENQGPSVMEKGGAVEASSKRSRVLGDISNAGPRAPVSAGGEVFKNTLSVLTNVTGGLMSVASGASAASEAMQTEPVHDPNRPYMDRPSDDIDARDADNPLLVTEYVNEMYDIFSTMEKDLAVSATYMSKQQSINEKMRTILVDWLVEVHLKFKMVPETLYLTVNILDRYLQLKQVRRSKLQLVGVAALLLASKYEEIYAPELRDLVYITDRAYTKEEIVETESEIVNTLQYNLAVPTIHTFLCRFLKAAHADRTMVQMACFLAERSLQEYGMLTFAPSIIAAASVLVSRKTLKRHPWSPTLVKYTRYDEPQLEACVAAMREALAGPQAQQAVSRKYTSPKFGAVATLQIDY